MHGRSYVSRASACAAAGLLLAGCPAPVSDPPDPALAGAPQEPQQAGEQAETDAVVATSPGGDQVLVVGHRYTGPHPLNNDPLQPPDIQYGPGNGDIFFRRGASIMGWSYSLDGGDNWTAPGKIYPTTVFGDPVAIMWSDPALARGYEDETLVAYASLAASTARYAQSDPDDVGYIYGWPPVLDIVDSVCVALSANGGLEFGFPTCVTPEGIDQIGSDQTTVAVGRDDRIYVAIDDFGASQIRLFEWLSSDFASELQPVPVDAEMLGYSRGPELRRDQAGEVWMSGISDAGTIRLCRVTNEGCTFVGEVSSAGETFPVLYDTATAPLPIRNGTTADFGVNRILSTSADLRIFVFAYSRFEGQRPVVGMTICSLSGLGNDLTCADAPQYGSVGRPGNHLQPNIEFVDKSAAQDGSSPDFRYAFYEFDSPSATAGRVEVTMGTLGPSTTFQELASPDPSVCPANYGGTGYWGDYFAFVAVPPHAGVARWRHVAAYSSDENRGCDTGFHPYQGRHLHVVAWRWVD